MPIPAVRRHSRSTHPFTESQTHTLIDSLIHLLTHSLTPPPRSTGAGGLQVGRATEGGVVGVSGRIVQWDCTFPRGRAMWAEWGTRSVGRMVDGHATIDLPPVGQRNVSLGDALP